MNDNLLNHGVPYQYGATTTYFALGTSYYKKFVNLPKIAKGGLQ